MEDRGTVREIVREKDGERMRKRDKDRESHTGLFQYIETADWNWAGFFTEGLETHWRRFGQFHNDL